MTGVLFSRQLHHNRARQVQRVSEGLFQSRITKPWLDALEDKRNGVHQGPERKEDRDLSPKKMSDTYHKAVWIWHL